MQKNPTRQRRGSVVLVTPRPGSTPTTKAAYNDDTVKKMGFRHTMRRWFGGRYKQMSNREVNELDRQITAEMSAGTFRAVRRGPQPPTADELWEEGVAPADDPEYPTPVLERLPTMASSIGGGGGGGGGSRPPTSVSQVSRGNNRYYDEYGDDYGGYHDGYGYGYGGGGGASSDSGYAAGYFERPALPPPPIIPLHHQEPNGRNSPAWYVPGGGPFDTSEAKPESVYDGGSRANSMRSNVTRGSRRPATQQGGYYPPPSRLFRENRSYSMQSDPGRLYARSPLPRVPYVPAQQSWDEEYVDGGGAEGGYEYGRGGGGVNGYRGWNGENIVEHEYPIDNRGYGEDYQYRES